MDDLQSALRYIPSDERETWVRVGMGIQFALGDAGLPIFLQWSSSAASYRERDAIAAWKSFKPRAGGVTTGTIYHMAMERGWQPAGGAPPKPDPRAAEDARRRAAIQARADASRAYRAALKAEAMVRAATPATHPYLESKGFPDEIGLVLDDLLLVPMRNLRTLQIQSVQTITPDGDKKFLAGGRAKGAIHRVGRGGTTWYCEGLATALSVRRALQSLSRTDTVYVCFSAANLAHVATRGYVVADRDESGTGQKYAAQTGLPYWMPPEVGTDANDFHLTYGLGALARELARMIY